jgi:hypothetical protein
MLLSASTHLLRWAQLSIAGGQAAIRQMGDTIASCVLYLTISYQQ